MTPPQQPEQEKHPMRYTGEKETIRLLAEIERLKCSNCDDDTKEQCNKTARCRKSLDLMAHHDEQVRRELVDSLITWLEPQSTMLLKQRMYRKLLSLRGDK